MEIRRARPQRRWTTRRPDNQAKVQVGAMKHSRRANCVVPTNTSHHSTTRPRLCEGHASLTTPINSVKPDKGAARWRGLPHYQWTPPGAELGTSRMQFKNTSDVTLRTDKNTHPIRGKLHAELGNDQQHTRTPGTADERHQAITTRISHIIYLGHFLRCAKNVAIPTMQVQYLNETKGNYVRNCSAHPKPRPRSGPPPTDTASNPAHTCRKVTPLATRFVHPHSWPQPTKTPTFPHQHNEKSTLQQHVVSYNPFLAPRAILGTIKPGTSASFR